MALAFVKIVLGLLLSFVAPEVLAEQTPHWRPLLFSLKKDGKESFLLAITDLPINYNQFPQVLKNAFAGSDTYIEDWDRLGMLIKSQNTPSKLLYRDMLSAKINLSKELSREQWKRLKSVIHKSMGAPSFWIARMKPWRAFSQYRSSIYQFPGRVEDSLAANLQKLAQSQDKKIYFLDPEFKLMQIIEKAVGVQRLKQLLDRDPGEIRQEREEFIKSFWIGDLNNIQKEKQSHEIKDDLEFRAEQELVELQLGWISMMQNFHLKSQRHAFFAISVDQVFGSQGILELMSSWGFEVKRVEDSCQNMFKD